MRQLRISNFVCQCLACLPAARRQAGGQEIRIRPASVFLRVVALSVVGVPLIAGAQPLQKVARLGWVGPPSARSSAFLEALRQGMRDLGYVEGQNLAIEPRWADGGLDRVAALTADLVRLKVDVIVTQGPVVSAVKKMAGTIPVVFGFSGDPAEARLVTSLPHPGGTLTGMTFLSIELAGKRLAIDPCAGR